MNEAGLITEANNFKKNQFDTTMCENSEAIDAKLT